MATERKTKTRKEQRVAKAKNAQRVKSLKQQEGRENIHVTLTQVHSECVALSSHAHSIALTGNAHLKTMKEGEEQKLFAETLEAFAGKLKELVDNLGELKESWADGRFDCWNDELDPNDLMAGLQLHQHYSTWIEAYYATCGSMISYLSAGANNVNVGTVGHTGD